VANTAGGAKVNIRVSTTDQGQSGLGLEAQNQAVMDYAGHVGGQVIAEFVEVESGGRNDRPELAKALDMCRRHKATLTIAKLDRLARNLAFISKLMSLTSRLSPWTIPTPTSSTCWPRLPSMNVTKYEPGPKLPWQLPKPVVWFRAGMEKRCFLRRIMQRPWNGLSHCPM